MVISRNSLCLCLVATTFLVQVTTSFVTPYPGSSSSLLILEAKKKKRGSGGKGFGKAPVQEEVKPKPVQEAAAYIDGGQQQQQQQQMLKSIEGGSNSIPQVEIDDNVPVEQRTSSLLRDKYGLRTREEQEAEKKRQDAAREQQQKLAEWKAMADAGEDFDVMSMLPDPVLIFIDRFLKAGVAICTVLFVLAGIGITVEAWSKTSDSPLPEDLDNFIVNVVEPNFTPGLLVLLGFSVSLGAFAALQLSSASSTYREDR